MTRERILKEFSVLNCIINQENLERYVDFCIAHNKDQKVDSSTHHILPRAKTLPFVKYENLQSNTWNKSELSYHDHYIAHYLLTLAINHIAVHTAFCGMHKKDLTLNRLSVDELIPEDKFTEIYKARNKLISERRLEKIFVNGVWISRATLYLRSRILSDKTQKYLSDRMQGDRNIVNLPGILEKIRATKSKIVGGTNIDKISADRAATTMNKEIVIDGITTTIYKETAKKISATVTGLIYEDGFETTIAKKRGITHSKILREKGFWYRIRNVFDPEINYVLSAVDVRNISPALDTKTINNYLGKSKFGQTTLYKRGKSNLIGLYAERLESTH